MHSLAFPCTRVPTCGAYPGPAATTLVDAGVVVTTSQSEYDERDRMSASIDNFGRRTEMTYDDAGRTLETRTQVKDEHGNLLWAISRSVYDELGRVVASMDRYVVDATGEPLEMTQGTISLHDAAGRMIGSERRKVLYSDPMDGESGLTDRCALLSQSHAESFEEFVVRKRSDWGLVLVLVSHVVAAGAVGGEGPSPGRESAGEAAVEARLAVPSDADFAAHVATLRKRLPSDGFTIVVQKPFVVIGDESPAMVERRAKRTVKWAVDQLKASYFEHDPEQILDIWLFKDRRSYMRNATKLFGRRPHTPYGYFSSRHRALVMNIATGGGTLVHEIVHPFVEANFPACPAWFNEGLGSLYEQSAERDGRIVGLTNWRLAGLKDAIRAKKLRSFASLCGTTTDEFYGQGSGAHYAQARYLCYYLQEHGLLRKYYRAFFAARADDPTGYRTLLAILDKTEQEMPAFQQTWEAWVLKLRFP